MLLPLVGSRTLRVPSDRRRKEALHQRMRGEQCGETGLNELSNHIRELGVASPLPLSSPQRFLVQRIIEYRGCRVLHLMTSTGHYENQRLHEV
ncbi:hypothetical protein J6590_013239 [Homalodisca vitripennis]|nr:hypothetical protein J6590_013239 [Homalodisca vitripennis]